MKKLIIVVIVLTSMSSFAELSRGVFSVKEGVECNGNYTIANNDLTRTKNTRKLITEFKLEDKDKKIETYYKGKSIVPLENGYALKVGVSQVTAGILILDVVLGKMSKSKSGVYVDLVAHNRKDILLNNLNEGSLEYGFKEVVYLESLRILEMYTNYPEKDGRSIIEEGHVKVGDVVAANIRCVIH